VSHADVCAVYVGDESKIVEKISNAMSTDVTSLKKTLDFETLILDLL